MIAIATLATGALSGATTARAQEVAASEFALATSTGPEESDSTVELTASRTSGVAPLSVFFETEGTVVSGFDDPFHQGLFEWNFGDPEAGTWGPSGRAKNTAAGPLAHHVYETPGVYLATVKVRDAEGRVASKSVEITVTDPNEVFAGEKTVCLSSTGNFDGCPDGATQQESSGDFRDVASQLGSERRVLLRRGEIWTGGGISIPADATTGIIGAFGEGDAPVIEHGGVGIDTDGNDYRIMDLHMVSTNAGTAIGHGPGDDVLVTRVAMDGYHYGFGEAAGGGEEGVNFAAVDNVIGPLVGGRGGYGAFLRGNGLAMQGNTFEDATQVEHTFRSSAMVHGVVSHNDFGPPAPTKHALKFHAHAVTGGQVRYSERIVVSDNILHGENSGWVAAFAPQNKEKDERLRDLIFERNHVITNGAAAGVAVMAQRVTLRNNLIDVSGGGPGACVTVRVRGIEPAPDTIRIYNNTCYSADGAAPRMAQVDGTSKNVTVSNNLIVSHNSGEPRAVAGGGGNVTDESNLATTDAVFVQDAPVESTDFALRAGSPAIDAASAPLGAWIDIRGRDAALDGNGDGTAQYDLGASEFVAE